MKNIFTLGKCVKLLVLSLVLTLVFACTLPSSIEITGSPSIEFSFDMDFNDIFTEMMTEAFGDASFILDRTHADFESRTLLVGTNVEEMDLEIELENVPESGLGEGTEYDLYIDGEIIEVEIIGGVHTFKNDAELFRNDEPLMLEISSFNSNLEGFKFADGIKAYLYISGSELVTSFTTELEFKIGGVTQAVQTIESGHLPKASGLKGSDTDYSHLDVPDGYIEIAGFSDLLASGEDLEINYVIGVKAGGSYDPYSLDGGEPNVILMELVIHFPMIFEAAGDTTLYVPDSGIRTGASFNFSELDSIGGIIQGLSESTEDVEFNNVEFIINLTENPFKDGYLVLSCPYSGITIINEPTETSLKISLSMSDLDAIAGAYHFEPAFNIFMENGEFLSIPKDFRILSVSLNADFSIVIEL